MIKIVIAAVNDENSNSCKTDENCNSYDKW